jgi:phage shock protein PspC (stress-responsive transcriptional regulator)
MDSTTESTTRLGKDGADPIDGSGPAYDGTGVPSHLAPVPEPAARSTFRLRRSRTDRMLGGVCGGLAESLGVDAAVIRIGLVTLTVLGFGTGVVLYAAVWMLAPETDEA